MNLHQELESILESIQHLRQEEEDDEYEAAMKRPAAAMKRPAAAMKRPAAFLDGADDPDYEGTSRKKAYEFERRKVAGEIPEYILAMIDNAPPVCLSFYIFYVFRFSMKTNLKQC